MADLNLLFMCGVYPYTPDALIEVDLDEGRVWVRFAEWFRRPLRLSPPEGLALVAAARAILGVPMTGDEKPDALASAVAKLETVLGVGGDDQLEIELGAAAPDVLGALQTAVADGRKVRLDYYSFGRDGDRGPGGAAVAGVLLGGPLVPAGVVRKGGRQAAFPCRPGALGPCPGRALRPSRRPGAGGRLREPGRRPGRDP